MHPLYTPTGARPPTTVVGHEEPSALEKRHYYDGLALRPRLVARTSRRPWDPDSIGATQKLLLPPLRGHQAALLWNEPEQHMATALRAVLLERRLRFTSVALWRVGYSHDFAPSRGAPPIVLVTVPPGSATWAQALRAALDCKALLERVGMMDVDIEVREPRRDSEVWFL